MNRFNRIFIIPLLLSILLVSPVAADGAPADDSNRMWLVETELEITNTHPQEVSRNIMIEMPLMKKHTNQGRIVNEDFSIEAEEITTNNDGDRTATFTVDQIGAQKTVSLSIQYHVMAGETENPADIGSCPTDIKRDSQSEPLKQKSEKLTDGLDSEMDKLSALQKYVHNYMTYDAQSPYRNSGDSLTALEHGEGVCEDYAALLVDLARASGIPSRMVFGYRRSDRHQRWIRHAWTDHLVDDEWLSADPTFHSSPGLDGSSDYLAQRHADDSISIRYSSAKLRAQLGENIRTKQLPE